MAYKPKILVVENETATQRQLEAALKALGAEPRCTGKGREAAHWLNKEKFDGAFVSWDVPDLGGQDLTKMIRGSKSNAKIPVAMLTTSSDSKALAAGFKAGVTFFLSKPIGPKELQRLVGATRGPMLEERLRYQRVPLAAPVTCAWADQRASGQGVDLSASGLLLMMKPGPEMGTEVALEFTLPRTHDALKMSGTVVRSTPAGQVGVKFFKVTAEQREQLKSFVDRTLGTGR